MPQLFNQAQAQLLASNFLNTIGSNPDLNDLKLDKSVVALINLAGGLANEAVNNLQQGAHISSGALSDSFKVLNPEYVNRNIQVDVQALFYYQFLNRGVKGTKGGSGQFSFKNSYPSRSMVNAIAAWMKRAGLSVRNVKQAYGKLESKNKSITLLSSAYAVARCIKQKGIKKSGFFDKAVTKVQQIAPAELGKAFKIDIIESLPKSLNELK